MHSDDEVSKSDEKVSCIIEEKVPVTLPDLHHDPKMSTRDTIRQIITGCVAFCIVIQAGANMSYSSILLPQLTDEKSLIHIQKAEASWIASIVAIAVPLGSFMTGPLIDMFGRKKICILITIPFTIGWLFQIFATDLWHIYTARVVAGFSGGLTTAAIVYVSEISHPTLRQSLLSMNSVFVSLGVLLTYFFGTWIRWKLTAIILCSIAIVNSFAMFFLPESPFWYMIFKDDYKGARRSFRWFYRNEEIYESEYQHLLFIKTKRRNTNNEENKLLILKREMMIYAEKSVYKPAIILILLFIAQQITGGYVIIFYATDIFRKLDAQNQNQIMGEFSSLILLGIIRFIVSIVTVIISQNIGRRKILILSGVGMAFCSFFAGVYIYFTLLPDEEMVALNITPTDKTFNMAFIFVLGYVAFGSFGFLVIPWTLIGELLPVKVRGVLGGILISFAYVLMFLCVKIFPSILDSIDTQCIFYIVSIFNLVSVMFVYFFLPETLGKNFDEIESYFEK